MSGNKNEHQSIYDFLKPKPLTTEEKLDRILEELELLKSGNDSSLHILDDQAGAILSVMAILSVWLVTVLNICLGAPQPFLNLFPLIYTTILGLNYIVVYCTKPRFPERKNSQGVD